MQFPAASVAQSEPGGCGPCPRGGLGRGAVGGGHPPHGNGSAASGESHVLEGVEKHFKNHRLQG